MLAQSVVENVMKKKQTCHPRLCASRCLIWGLEIEFVKNDFFLENYITSEGAVSHNVLYYQPLPITSYLVRFYANNYFE